MIKVSSIDEGKKNSPKVISHAARSCYEDSAPKWGKLIDIKSRLFETSHHTTLQHTYFTFFIEDIAVGDVTFGLHLASPFYNTSQRSGRFCGKMFANPDYEKIKGYVQEYWPEVTKNALQELMDYVKYGIEIYQSNIRSATIKAEEFIQKERPNANEKYIKMNGSKIAQEQLRMFIPVIFPTALDFTINLSALAALYRVAWSAPMKDVTQKMVNLVLKKYPEFDYMFTRKEDAGSRDNAPVNILPLVPNITTEPTLKLISPGDWKYCKNPQPDDIHPLDLLQFSPWLMNNNVEEIKTFVGVSVATMGQDQRHRTIRRGQPIFYGGLYLPPIPKNLGLEKEAFEVVERWRYVYKKISLTLACALAPYGAIVGYQKSASYNAIIHESAKRLCWCAQEEIYHLARSLRTQLASETENKHPLLEIMSPCCVVTGKCGEGVRYCGRDLKNIKDNPFPERCV